MNERDQQKGFSKLGKSMVIMDDPITEEQASDPETKAWFDRVWDHWTKYLHKVGRSDG